MARRYLGNPNPIIPFQDLLIDFAARRVLRGAKAVSLTAREWVLFEVFLQNPARLFAKSQLEERLYSFDIDVDSNTIEVHLSHLRKKLGALAISTERGLGYRLGQA